MKKKLKILLVQNSAVVGDRDKNIKNVSKLLEPYKGLPVDLIVFPEVWSIGWDCDLFPKLAEDDENSPTVDFLSDLAKEFKTNIAGGSYIRKHSDGSLRNTSPVLDRKGKLIARYDKMHLFSYSGSTEGACIKEGNELIIAQTDIGKLGITVCYDIRFPELFRKYTYAGADILINMAAWGRNKKNQWVTLQKARAIENQIFMIAVSQTGRLTGDYYNIGHSMVINPLGNIVGSLRYEKAVLSVEIDLDEMKNFRKEMPMIYDVHEKYEFTEVV